MSEKMENELNEEIKKIHNEIQKDWNLTGKLVQDFIAIVTSFSGRVHGMRSHKNKRKNRSNNKYKEYIS